MVQSPAAAVSASASSASSSSLVSSPLRKKPRIDPLKASASVSNAKNDHMTTTASASLSTFHWTRPGAMQGGGASTKAHWDLYQLLRKPTSFPNESGALALGEFDADNADETLQFLQQECKLLIIGAGGLGCELLKNCVLSGFKHIEIIDMDTIDVSNLNRQFLFRQRDVGKSKAQCAAEFVKQRMKGLGAAVAKAGQEEEEIEIVAHFKKVQDMDMDFYRQFHVILSGLDNIEARRYVNSVVVSLAEMDDEGNVDPSTIIPLIDGGTEGLRGQARVIIPRVTSCFECSLESFPPQTAFPMCTIAETPRQPAHCIAYAFLVLWPKVYADKKLDKDDPEHMQWVYETARERAKQYGIQGVTYSLTLGVVKNIIPAVASTNAIVAAMCVNEALKAMSYCSQLMNNYHMHMGSLGCYSHTFEYERKSNECVVCCSQQRQLVVSREMTLQQLLDKLVQDEQFRLLKPSICSSSKNLFMQGPPALKQATSKNLPLKLGDLVANKEVLTITDPVFVGEMALELKLCFE